MKIISNLQNSIHNTLSNNQNLTGIGIHHQIMKVTKLPYINILNTKITQIPEEKAQVFKVETEINIFTDDVLNENCLNIMEIVKNAMINIIIPNFFLLNSVIKNSEISKKNHHWYGVILFEFIIK